MVFEHQNERDNQAGQGTVPKTFTQEQVNAMIGERLSREREKYADYDAMKVKAEKLDQQEETVKTDLQKVQDYTADLQKQVDAMKAAGAVRAARDKVAAVKGVPAELLTGSTEEECDAQADKLLEWYSEADQYAETHDCGEIQISEGGGSPRDQFAEWCSQKLAFNSVENESGWVRII